jgi:hypothetical protein
MKIVNREQFLALPAGTLFSKYEPQYFEPLSIKGDTWTNDFLVQEIHDAVDASGSEEFGNILDLAVEHGYTFKLDLDCMGRDGCFAENQLFAVWEKQDVEQLIARLTRALAEGYGA